MRELSSENFVSILMRNITAGNSPAISTHEGKRMDLFDSSSPQRL
jgi:hypothetical protein